MLFLNANLLDLETVKNNKIELTIVREADFTGRVQQHPDLFEMSAIAEDENGNRFEISWVFEDDGRDLDDYDYSSKTCSVRLLS